MPSLNNKSHKNIYCRMYTRNNFLDTIGVSHFLSTVKRILQISTQLHEKYMLLKMYRQ